MTLFHFGDSPDLVAEDPSTGKASVGVRATLWTSKTGGTQWTAGVTDLTSGGVGGVVVSGAFGRWSFTINDATDSAATIWLQPEGASGSPGVRWLARAWESYGPPGPKGDPGDLEGIAATDGTVLAHVGGAWAAKSPTTDLGLGTAADVATANQNAAAAQATAQQALDKAGSGAVIPNGGATRASLVKNTTADGDVGWRTLTFSDVGAAPTVHTHTAAQVTGLAQVATSGDYNHLTNRPAASYSAAQADARFVQLANAGAKVLVLASGDPVPIGTPADTVIVRK